MNDSVYAGLLDSDSAHWAFGQDFEDPLAGLDTTVPAGVDAAALAATCLALGDDALIAAHRLSEWCSNAPDLEDDIAVANVALDLLGQARLLLARAAAADPSLVPRLPEGSPVPADDALAFFREPDQFRNVWLVELPRADFAHLVVSLLLLSTVRLALAERLMASADPVLSAIAGKAVKELAYHRDYSGRWFLTLARGTDESRRRLMSALDRLWPCYPELIEAHEAEAPGLSGAVDSVLDEIFGAGGVDRPVRPPVAGLGGRQGREGVHTEALGRLLAEMQVVARAHPRGSW